MSPAEGLAELGRSRLEEIGLAGRQLGQSGALAGALGWSDFLYRLFLRLEPPRRQELLERAEDPLTRAGLRATGSVEEGLALIALRELAGLQPVRASLLALSLLAESTLQRAVHALSATAVSELVVFGLGKLGGRELNFYSDLDLVLAHPGAGERDERRHLRAARQLLEALEGGFRIDLRLRPFGQSGPLVMGLEAMEAYFQNHGRDWERYAWLKARAVAGRRPDGRDFLARLHPFIYRRYLDYHAVEALREMKQQIAAEAGALADDIKQGPGGIREIEFVVQAFQLVRGGREPMLAGTSLRAALAAACRLGHLEPETGGTLLAAYEFLRKVENRLQMASLAPVHTLPENPARRAALAASLGFGDPAAFADELARHRAQVRAIFDDILGARPARAPVRGAAERLWRGEDVPAAAAELRLGSSLEALANFQRSRAVRLMGARGRRALDRLAPELISAAAAQPDPDAALQRLLLLLAALVRRSAYLALLVERGEARTRLIGLIGRSPWVAERLAATPAALDELLDERVSAPSSPQAVARQFRSLANLVQPGEEASEQLREANELQRLKIAAALIEDAYSPAQSEAALTVLAEHSIRAAVSLARSRMEARHGRLEQDLLAIGYGKLGSRELGFASDLDLVFVHAGTVRESAAGLAAETYLARLAQRALSMLSLPTLAGPLYTVDTRLRPEGAAGLLLSRFDAWRRYQAESAWLWERQALLRARPVAGSARLARRFNAERLHLLSRPLERERLQAEIVAMRHRVAAAGPPRTPASAALLDGEFLAACWLLDAAPRDSAVIGRTDLARQMTALSAGGHVADAPRLAAALAVLRGGSNRRVLGLLPDAEAEARARAFIEARWADTFAGTASSSL